MISGYGRSPLLIIFLEKRFLKQSCKKILPWKITRPDPKKEASFVSRILSFFMGVCCQTSEGFFAPNQLQVHLDMMFIEATAETLLFSCSYGGW